MMVYLNIRGDNGPQVLYAKIGKQFVKFIIITKITMFQILNEGEDGLGGVAAILYQQDWDHVLKCKEDGVVGTSNLLEMVLVVLEVSVADGYLILTFSQTHYIASQNTETIPRPK